MGKMTMVQIEDTIVKEVKSWWDMNTDCEYKWVIGHASTLQCYVDYFHQLNNKYVRNSAPCKWVQINVILNEIGVLLDREELDDEKKWDKMLECFDWLWTTIELSMV